MDPNATLELMRNAIVDKDWESTAQYAAALDIWLHNGGFLPTDWSDSSAQPKRVMGGTVNG